MSGLAERNPYVAGRQSAPRHEHGGRPGQSVAAVGRRGRGTHGL